MTNAQNKVIIFNQYNVYNLVFSKYLEYMYYQIIV
jgi:hypothetical protein